MNEEVKEGVIKSINGHPMSGLWTIVFEDEQFCFIESGYGMRALAGVFGIREGIDRIEAFYGKQIRYSTDDFNVMEGFTPVEEE